MGIDVSLWRARIGTFTQPLARRGWVQGLKLMGVSLCIRTVLFYLLVVHGIEMNPGPGPGT